MEDLKRNSSPSCYLLLRKVCSLKCSKVQKVKQGKVIPVLNYSNSTPWRHMGEWRYSSTIRDLGSSFTPWPLYLRGKSPWYPLDRRFGRPQSRSGRCGVEKTVLPLPGIEPQPSSP
jgi:hypothetical protein